MGRTSPPKSTHDSLLPADAVYEVLRPIVRVLRASGLPESAIVSAIRRATAKYRDATVRGIWIDYDRYLELAKIVMIWARDIAFIDEAGSPRKLDLRRGENTFVQLLKKANASIQPRQALDYLLALGSVRLCNGGTRVRLVSNVLLTVMRNRFLIPPTLREIRRFAETIEHNVCERPRPFHGRMHRWAENTALSLDQFVEAQRFVRLSGQNFLDAVDEKLNSCASTNGTRTVKYGVGVYVFVDKTERARTRKRPKKPRAAESNEILAS